MDTNILEKQVNALEARMEKLGSQLRLTLFSLLGLIVIMAIAGAFAFGNLFSQAQQQKHDLAQHVAAAAALNNAASNNLPPPGAQSPSAEDEEP